MQSTSLKAQVFRRSFIPKISLMQLINLACTQGTAITHLLTFLAVQSVSLEAQNLPEE